MPLLLLRRALIPIVAMIQNRQLEETGEEVGPVYPSFR